MADPAGAGGPAAGSVDAAGPSGGGGPPDCAGASGSPICGGPPDYLGSPDGAENAYETSLQTYLNAYLQSYSNKTVPFQFRGIDFHFALSLGLFSSADIDRGSRFLLKVFSRLMDEDLAQGRPLPRRILDAGCGAGVIGICAGRALAEAAGPAGDDPLVCAQDRDELARIFTLGNGVRNRLGGAFCVRTEALLDGGAGETWDLILSNVPAKAGKPVLEDFIGRSAGLLAPGGRALIVVVNTLADFFRAGLGASGASLIREEAGPEHRVFVYGAGDAGGRGTAPAGPGGELPGPRIGPLRRSVYLRNSGRCEMEGAAYRIDTVHGAAEFDRPDGAVETAAKLLRRLGPLFPAADSLSAGPPPAGLLSTEPPFAELPFTALIHEGGQGHFPLWFLEFLKRGGRIVPGVLVLHGRNILALWAARSNIVEAAGGTTELRLAPGVDLGLDRAALAARLAGESPAGAGSATNTGSAADTADADAARQRCAFIAAFPEFVPGTNPYGRLWEGLAGLLLPGGLALIALPAVEMDRLLKRRPPGFTRLGDLKRRGFRALACRLGHLPG